MAGTPLRIIHAVRAPVGGIFRHILDLANGQAERGHEVGIISDSLTGGPRAAAAFAEIAPQCKLGIHRLPIHRAPHPSDILAWGRVSHVVNRLKPDVLHGHGAKAGVFVRARGSAKNRIRVYTPHGGSLHFDPDSREGRIYMQLERSMMNRTELFLFESDFARRTYEARVGKPAGLVRTVFNGVGKGEFEPIDPAGSATDITYVGEFRHIKGADLLIEALARVRSDGRALKLTLAGDGEETESLKSQVTRLGLDDAVSFIGHVPARTGFAHGRLIVVPSRGDSMPYVVIEAGAAGMPMIAAAVGGIPEIFGEFTTGLFPPGDVRAMADAITNAFAQFDQTRERAALLRERIGQHFSQSSMVDGVLAAYQEAFAEH